MIVAAAVVIATSGDSWAVKMILGLVAIDVAVRFYRWAAPDRSHRSRR